MQVVIVWLPAPGVGPGSTGAELAGQLGSGGVEKLGISPELGSRDASCPLCVMKRHRSLQKQGTDQCLVAACSSQVR